MGPMKKTWKWDESGREKLEITLNVDGDQILGVEVHSTGCLAFLELSQEMKTKLVGTISQLQPPQGKDHPALIWREMILKMKGEWVDPYKDDELCHCRKIPTLKVDRAIVYGAHTIEEVRQQTSANTGCGTCRPDVLSLIENRLKKAQ